jgi:hypothetical protein
MIRQLENYLLKFPVLLLAAKNPAYTHKGTLAFTSDFAEATHNRIGGGSAELSR